tara:strand:+ start:447 stop:620 length:174 start_codon:yes stop_codon:yes gene_type:complete
MKFVRGDLVAIEYLLVVVNLVPVKGLEQKTKGLLGLRGSSFEEYLLRRYVLNPVPPK